MHNHVTDSTHARAYGCVTWLHLSRDAGRVARRTGRPLSVKRHWRAVCSSTWRQRAPRGSSTAYGRQPKAEPSDESSQACERTAARARVPQSASGKQIWLPCGQIIMRSGRAAAVNERVRVRVRCCWRAGLRRRRSTTGIMGKAAPGPPPVSVISLNRYAALYA